MYKNNVLLEKAKKLLPELIETKVQAVRCVDISRDGEKIIVEKADDFQGKELRKGDKVILDFGNHQVGYLNLKLSSHGSHPDAPVLLKLHFAEQPIEFFEDPAEYKGWICSSWIEEEITHVDVLPSTLSVNRRYAFRYVEIEIVDISSKFAMLVDEAFCIAVSSADDDRLCPFECDDARVKRIDEIAVRTLHNCMQTVFEDGPKRDRRLWAGDLRMQALANYETYRMNDMVKACLYMFAALPLENGKVGAAMFLEPEIEVDDIEMYDYALLYIASVRDYYKATKDLEAVNELWDTCQRQIELALKQCDENYLVKDSDAMGWCFVDWNLNLNKQASAQGILLYSLLAAIELADILGDKEAENSLKENYQRVKKASRRLWSEEKNCFVSGDDKQVSIASQVWMILGKAIESDEAGRLINDIVLRENAEEMVTPYMYHNYIDALMSIGQKERAFKELMNYWGQMADLGADTFFELFNPKNPNESPYGGTIVNSYCHAWSCAPAYFLRKNSKCLV